MKEPTPQVSCLAILADCVSAVLLTLYSLIIGPLGLLRGPLVFDRLVWYGKALIPNGLLSRSVRAFIDWRVGHFAAAIVQAEGIIAKIEELYAQKKSSYSTRVVLSDLYTLLARAYLHTGHIDEAMRVVIRAKKNIGCDRLPGLAELDAKTAHLVRAGLAAGKLVEGGGLATLFVKADSRPTPQESQPRPTDKTNKDLRHHQVPPKGQTHNQEREAKIIPFPLNH